MMVTDAGDKGEMGHPGERGYQGKIVVFCLKFLANFYLNRYYAQNERLNYKKPN